MIDYQTKNLRKTLQEQGIKYIEDEMRFLISLEENIYTATGIVDVMGLKVEDEVINHEEFGGDNKHYYLIKKSDKTRILRYTEIENAQAIDIFNNRCIIDCDKWYATKSDLNKCIPSDICFETEYLGNGEFIVNFTNAILL